MRKEQRDQYARDILGMLAGFDVPYVEARLIISEAYTKIRCMNATTYENDGIGVKAIQAVKPADPKPGYRLPYADN